MDFGNKAELEREIRRLFELYVRKNDKAAFLQYLKTDDVCRRLDSETCLALCLLTGAKELEDYYLGREGAGRRIVCEGCRPKSIDDRDRFSRYAGAEITV